VARRRVQNGKGTLRLLSKGQLQGDSHASEEKEVVKRSEIDDDRKDRDGKKIR